MPSSDDVVVILGRQAHVMFAVELLPLFVEYANNIINYVQKVLSNEPMLRLFPSALSSLNRTSCQSYYLLGLCRLSLELCRI